ncbi:WAP four-disulfide core domain protein 3 [Anolis carolinensis]|uniref:WAP four-disulfide core domain protein 3 n=1 Tax=Anolis carolinensis TaxID=28377 RepID=UPI002F2B58D0
MLLCSRSHSRALTLMLSLLFSCSRALSLSLASWEKSGHCPPPLTKKLTSPALCGTLCSEDEGCPGQEKCCQTTCGHACKAPLEGDEQGVGALVRGQGDASSGGGRRSSRDPCIHPGEGSIFMPRKVTGDLSTGELSDDESKGR